MEVGVGADVCAGEEGAVGEGDGEVIGAGEGDRLGEEGVWSTVKKTLEEPTMKKISMPPAYTTPSALTVRLCCPVVKEGRVKVVLYSGTAHAFEALPPLQIVKAWTVSLSNV